MTGAIHTDYAGLGCGKFERGDSVSGHRPETTCPACRANLVREGGMHPGGFYVALPGEPTFERTLMERITFRAAEPGAQYGYIDRTRGKHAHRAIADGVVVTRKTGAQENVTIALLLSSGSSYSIEALTLAPQDVLEFVEQYAPEFTLTTEQVQASARLRVVDLDSSVHLADGDAHLPACGATAIWHVGESNVADHLVDVTCPECKAIGEERGWERDEERRLQQAGEAARDRAVDRDIDSRRER